MQLIGPKILTSFVDTIARPDYIAYGDGLVGTDRLVGTDGIFRSPSDRPSGQGITRRPMPVCALKRRTDKKTQPGKPSAKAAGAGGSPDASLEASAEPPSRGASAAEAHPPQEAPSPIEPPTRSPRRAHRTRSRLEKGRLSPFVEVGLGPTTIEMITERADVGKGTFYQHFSTKEELLAVLVDGAVERLLGRIGKAVAGKADIRSTLDALVSAHLAHFQASREEFILFFQGHGVVSILGSVPEELEASYLRYLERLEGILRERLPAAPGDVPLRRMACAIAGFAIGYLSFALLGLAEENLQQTYRPVREALLNALAALAERALAPQSAVSEKTQPPAAAPAAGEAGSPRSTPAAPPS